MQSSVLLDQGERALREGEIELALRLFREVLDLHPDSLESLEAKSYLRSVKSLI